MKKQIDYILLGTLWLLAATLGASFWFNTQFGFNIFSGAHWQYLGQLQASDMHVRPMFYVSMVVAVVVTIAGLYLLMQPRLRRLRTPQWMSRILRRRKTRTTMAPDDASIIVTAPAQSVTPPPTPQNHTPRPPRLNVPHITPRPASPTAPAGTASTAAPAPMAAPAQTMNFDDIKQIFESAGYVVKPAPRIAGIRPALFAIGADETLWMGAVGIEPARLNAAMERLNGVFTDTLEDIVIHINGFVIDARTAVPDGANIELFDSVAELRTYMDAHRNRDMTDAERDDFAAYSEYIDTVSNYLNKV